MIIYKDIITGDELLSETYDIKEVDGVLFEIDTKKVPRDDDIDVNTGGNPSEDPENADEGGGGGGGGAGVKMVYEIVKAFQLGDVTDENGNQAPYDKSQYTAEFKKYVKRVKEALEAKGTPASEVKAFMEGATKNFKRLAKTIGECDTYLGSTDDPFEPQGMRVIIDYREDGMTPFAIIWKHGLTEMKV